MNNKSAIKWYFRRQKLNFKDAKHQCLGGKTYMFGIVKDEL